MNVFICETLTLINVDANIIILIIYNELIRISYTLGICIR